ncbi:MAG: hypothetical protein C4547_04675 [Phycisphaerales bacterium]|nr:MAG: hypothetical protein C4547_04675 [Phycisphaerales bacterium]
MTAAVLCCVAGVASGVGFTWITDDCPLNDPCSWQYIGNWEPDTPTCAPCYPSSSNDDATIPLLEDHAYVDLGDSDFTIDDFTITSTTDDNVTFMGSATISVDTLVITGPTSSGYVAVYFIQGTKLVASSP